MIIKKIIKKCFNTYNPKISVETTEKLTYNTT